MKRTRAYLMTFRRLRHGLSSNKVSAKFLFILMGIASTIWFLIRVIPKPQRAGYPCMKAAAPIMSGFIIYILSLGGLTLLFKKSLSQFKKAKYWSALFAIVLCVVLLIVFNLNDAQKIYANTFGFSKAVLPDGANNPMGVARGISPGRVVWTWNTAATNENCTNTLSNAFFMPSNNNQDTINKMADVCIKSVGGKSSVSVAWDAIFKDFNKRKTGTASGYTTGQTIFIKVNNGTAGWAINADDLSETTAISGTTPASVVAFIRQLVDSCGIPQDKIYVGEPMTHVYKSMYDAVHAKYPNVKVMDNGSSVSVPVENAIAYGRTISTGWHENAITYSDKGDAMPDAITDALMNEMYDADYLINIAALKAHARNGISLCAKLHFGSHGEHGMSGFGSNHLHDGLICVNGNDNMSGARVNYHMYRVLVDLMGNNKLGGNTVLFIVDGLWGGPEATDKPVKWKSAPFNNDWPNSLFVSQDEVALESVCLDFLRAEATVNTAFLNRPLFPAVDDYLHQAADPANWPAGITYDPEDDGTALTSLGVHEHWDNATDKKYSRNLTPATGTGIELVYNPTDFSPALTAISEITENLKNINVYPNPSSVETNISFSVLSNANVSINLISTDGKLIQNIKDQQMIAGNYTENINTSSLKAGAYVCVIKTTSPKGTDTQSVKLLVK